MIIDLEFYGYGAGLVVASWVFGMAISSVFDVLSAIRG